MDADKAKSSVDPRRYFEGVRTDSDRPAHDPVCLYLETTNRCNLLCTTCPRTYEELEPPADMSWQLFRSVVDQIPNLSRAVLRVTTGGSHERRLQYLTSATGGIQLIPVNPGASSRMSWI
jgi:MoaA/NifB/PqqE/SkfB family radical SAM enzyme